MKSENSGLIIYQSVDGKIKIDCRIDGESLWLTQAQIAQLFGRERSVITKHIRNIFVEGELDPKSNVQNLHIPNSDKPVAFYSLDVILAVSGHTASEIIFNRANAGLPFMGGDGVQRQSSDEKRSDRCQKLYD